MGLYYLERDTLWYVFSQCSLGRTLSSCSLHHRSWAVPRRARTVFEFPAPSTCLAHGKNLNKQMNKNTQHIMLTAWQALFQCLIRIYSVLTTLWDRYCYYPCFTYEEAEGWKVKRGDADSGCKPMCGALEFNLATTPWGLCSSPTNRRLLLCTSGMGTGPLCQHLCVSIRCSYTVCFLGGLKEGSNWTQTHKCRINESPILATDVFVRLFLKYLWGSVRAPAVLVTVETRQQNILISVHLAKPQCLLCVITDHEMAEDQLLYLRALVLKGKEYESQRASD